MPRQPDIKNKNDRLVYVPASLSEKKLSQDAKALCIQDGITIRDLISEALELAFKVHHWPPGNPQLTLTNYQLKAAASRSKCGFSGCKSEGVATGVFLPNNKEYSLCTRHFATAKNSDKVWKVKNLETT